MSRIFDHESAEWLANIVQMNSQLRIELHAYSSSHIDTIAVQLHEHMLEQTGVKVVNSGRYSYPEQGYTRVDILEASCAIVHTYPEYRLIIMETSLSRSTAWNNYRNWVNDLQRMWAFPEDAPKNLVNAITSIASYTETITTVSR